MKLLKKTNLVSSVLLAVALLVVNDVFACHVTIENCSNFWSEYRAMDRQMTSLKVVSHQRTSLVLPKLSKLTTIHIQKSLCLRDINLSQARNVTNVVVDSCVVLHTLDLSGLVQLQSLVIRDCSNLNGLKLPASPFLNCIKIKGINNLDQLSICYPEALTSLTLHYPIQSFRIDFPRFCNLQRLSLRLSSIPDMQVSQCLTSIVMLQRLQVLKLVNCFLPTRFNFSLLPELKKCQFVDVAGIKVIELSQNTNLLSLVIINGQDLQRLHLPRSLVDLWIKDCALLKFIDLSGLPDLIKLSLFRSPKTFNLACLPALKCLRLKGFAITALDMLNFPNLEKLEMDNCSGRGLKLASGLTHLSLISCALSLKPEDIPLTVNPQKLCVCQSPALNNLKAAYRNYRQLVGIYERLALVRAQAKRSRPGVNLLFSELLPFVLGYLHGLKLENIVIAKQNADLPPLEQVEV